MFGAIYGDVIGSYYEVHCTKDYNFEFKSESTFTDDSVLIASVCKAILNDPSDITRWGLHRRAKEYALQYRQYYSYHPHAGFGNMFMQWAKNPYARNNHSYANGASMRVIPIGYAYDTLEQTLLQAKASCLSTHSHREAIKGAQAVAALAYGTKSVPMVDKVMAVKKEERRVRLLIDTGVRQCVDCGCCSYVCPAHRPLLATNQDAKWWLKQYERSKQSR